MKDITREIGLQMQKGVRSSRIWGWDWAFIFRHELPGGTCYAASVKVWAWPETTLTFSALVMK